MAQEIIQNRDLIRLAALLAAAFCGLIALYFLRKTVDLQKRHIEIQKTRGDAILTRTEAMLAKEEQKQLRVDAVLEKWEQLADRVEKVLKTIEAKRMD